jgi:tRNA (mo5U34)-methyltransferase
LGSGSRALSVEELREEVIRLGPWHLEVEITPEVSTQVSLEIPPDAPGGTFYRMSFHSPREGFMRRMRRIFPNGLEGRSVMDCACNCGAYLLWCKELGAGDCYGFDAREHWIRQARFLAEHRGQTDGVRFEVHDLYDLDRVDPGRFDVTLFNGIFYHLPDPVYGMKLAADRTDQLLVVNTATRLGAPDGTLVAAKEAPDRAMSGVHGLNWFPAGPGVMTRILNWMEFPEVRCSLWRIASRQDAGNGRLEMIAAREHGFFTAYDGALPDERARVRELVSTTVPPGTTVAVVTPAGWEPLDFDGREGVEVARVEDGERTTDADVRARLDALEAGPRYVAIPDAAAQWLERRPELARHLRFFHVLTDQGSGCLLVLLDESQG